MLTGQRVWRTGSVILAIVLCISLTADRQGPFDAARLMWTAAGFLLGITAVMVADLSSARRTSWFALTVAVPFVVARGGWLLAVPTRPISDFHYYFQFGCSLAKGDGIENSVLSYFRNWWAYPLFLSVPFRLFGCQLRVAHAVAFVLAAVATWMFYLVACECADERTARRAVLLFAVWPAQIMLGSVVASEHLALPLALGGLYFGVRIINRGVVRATDAVAAGLLLAAGAIVRPAVGAFAVALVVPAISARTHWRRKGAVLAATVVVWTIVNVGYQRVFTDLNRGVSPSRSFSAAANLLYGLNFDSRGQWNESDLKTIGTWSRDDALAKSLSETARRLRAHSAPDTAKLVIAKLQTFWGAPDFAHDFSTKELDGPARARWFVGASPPAIAAGFHLFAVVATVAVVRFRGIPGRPVLAWIPWIAIAGSLLHSVFVVSPRYGYTFAPVLLLIAACGSAAKRDNNADLDIVTAGRTVSLLQRT